jgi:nitroreductase
METWDAIRARRDIWEYADRPIPDDHLDRILEAGRRSPSSQNWQPWDFILVTDRQQLQQLTGVWQGARHVAGSAATIAMIAPPPGNDQRVGRTYYDLGQATMSMMLAATDLGVGSAHSAVSDQALARQILGFPEDRHCYYMVVLGYPAGRPLTPVERPDRRPFDEVVHRGRW